MLGVAALDRFILKKFGEVIDGELCSSFFDCVFCGGRITWIGMCEECEKRKNEEATSLGKIEDRIHDIGVPLSMLSCSWDNFSVPKTMGTARIVDSVKNWRGVENPLVLAGSPGTGKTHMAVAVIRSRVQTKGAGGVAWISDAMLSTLLKDSYDRRSASLEEQIMRPRLLILDDLGQSHQSEWLVGSIFPILNLRLDEKKATVITTNLTQQDFLAIDARFADRLKSGLLVNTNSAGMTSHRQ